MSFDIASCILRHLPLYRPSSCGELVVLAAAAVAAAVAAKGKEEEEDQEKEKEEEAIESRIA